MEIEAKSKSDFPDVVLKIEEELFSLNSRYITSIMKMPKYNVMPGAAKGVLGVIDFRGDAIPLVDIRTLFSMPTVQDEYEKFREMIDEKKHDHITWMETLESSVKNQDEFTLTTDPHKCAFGRWFYNFQSTNSMINYHMKKIEEPHRKLHETAVEIERCEKLPDRKAAKECISKKMAIAKDECMPQIISLLDEAKDIFRSLYTEMIVVIENEEHKVALVVDEVVSVEKLSDMADTSSTFKVQHSDYICDVKQKEGVSELILELNDELFLRAVEHALEEDYIPDSGEYINT